MPLNRSQSRQKCSEQEGRLLLAIEAIQTKQITSVRDVARRFNLPSSTLSDRLTGRQNRAKARANNHKLTLELSFSSRIQYI